MKDYGPLRREGKWSSTLSLNLKFNNHGDTTKFTHTARNFIGPYLLGCLGDLCELNDLGGVVSCQGATKGQELENQRTAHLRSVFLPIQLFTSNLGRLYI